MTVIHATQFGAGPGFNPWTIREVTEGFPGETSLQSLDVVVESMWATRNFGLTITSGKIGDIEWSGGGSDGPVNTSKLLPDADALRRALRTHYPDLEGHDHDDVDVDVDVDVSPGDCLKR